MHLRNDNNTCFYIGKGHGERYKTKARNSHHDRIVAKFGMTPIIVKDGLTEKASYELEKILIHHYVFDLGYGIDIDGYRTGSSIGFLTNHTFGGDGSYGMVHSEKWRKQHSENMKGAKNPMYGKNVWDTYDKNKVMEVKAKISIKTSGENNPMFGISPKDRMDAKTYQVWYQKVSQRCKNQIGEKNPNYKNDTLRKKLDLNPDLRIQYYSRKATQNGRARKVSVYKNGVLLKTFSYIGECCEWLQKEQHIKAKTNSIRGCISESIKNNRTYHGFTFSYAD